MRLPCGSSARTTGFIDGRPGYVKHSIDDGRKVKIAAIDPDFYEASPLSLMEYAEWRLIMSTHSLVL
jgi:hypothetical protein